MPLLLPLVDLSAFLIALGLCVVAIFFVRALFGAAGSAVGWIPWVGSKIRGDLHLIEQKLTNELGQVVAGLDHAIARTWYRLAHTIEWVGKEIAANAAALGPIAALLAALPGFADWRAFIRKVKASLVWAEHHAIGAVHTATRGIAGELTHLEKWIGGRVRVIDHTIEVALPRDIAGLRTRARKLERLYHDLYKRIARTEARWATIAFAGTLVLALRYLRLNWIRCAAVGRVGRHICGLGPQLIEDLLAIGLEVVIVSDICQVANAIESAAILMEPELDKLVGLSDYLCRAGGASYPSAMVDSDRKGNGGNPTALIPADLAA